MSKERISHKDMESIARDKFAGDIDLSESEIIDIKKLLVNELGMTAVTSMDAVNLYANTHDRVRGGLDIKELRDDLVSFRDLMVKGMMQDFECPYDIYADACENYCSMTGSGWYDTFAEWIGDEADAYLLIDPEAPWYRAINGSNAEEIACVILASSSEMLAFMLENESMDKIHDYMDSMGGGFFFSAAVGLNCQQEAIRAFVEKGAKEDLMQLLGPYMDEGFVDMVYSAVESGTFNPGFDLEHMGAVLNKACRGEDYDEEFYDEELADLLIQEEIFNPGFENALRSMSYMIANNDFSDQLDEWDTAARLLINDNVPSQLNEKVLKYFNDLSNSYNENEFYASHFSGANDQTDINEEDIGEL